MTGTRSPLAAHTIGRLKAARRALRLSQAELAIRAAVPVSTVENLESGRRKDIYLSEVEHLCSALNLDPLRLMAPDPLTVEMSTEV